MSMLSEDLKINWNDSIQFLCRAGKCFNTYRFAQSSALPSLKISAILILLVLNCVTRSSCHGG